jgi:hypothetical protein
MRGGSAGTSVRGPESQEGACESLKGPIVLTIDVLFGFFFYLFWYFQLFLVYLENITQISDESLPVVLLDFKSSILREVSACPLGPKAVLIRLAKCLLEVMMAATLHFESPSKHIQI